jgi:hypothetical protein
MTSEDVKIHSVPLEVIQQLQGVELTTLPYTTQLECTPRLRYISRYQPARDGHSNYTDIQILQQLWIDRQTGKQTWKDVPFEPNPSYE